MNPCGIVQCSHRISEESSKIRSGAATSPWKSWTIIENSDRILAESLDNPWRIRTESRNDPDGNSQNLYTTPTESHGERRLCLGSISIEPFPSRKTPTESRQNPYKILRDSCETPTQFVYNPRILRRTLEAAYKFDGAPYTILKKSFKDPYPHITETPPNFHRILIESKQKPTELLQKPSENQQNPKRMLTKPCQNPQESLLEPHTTPPQA